MEKKFEFFVLRKQKEEWLDTDGPFDDFIEAFNYACRDWNNLSAYDKKNNSIEIYKQETLYDDDNEPVESEIVVEKEDEQFKVGQGYFMLNGKKYHIFDLKRGYRREQAFDVNLEDLDVNWDNFEIFENSIQDEIILAYKAVDNVGNKYEVEISHNIYEGVISSEYDKYTSKLEIIISYLN